MSRASSPCAEQPDDDRQGVSGRQPLRRAGELAADLDVGLDRGPVGQPGRRRPADTWPGSPSSRTVQSRTKGSACSSGLERRRLVQAADQVQGPERLERRSDPAPSRIIRFSTGAIDASLRSPISRRAVWRTQRFGSES